MTGVLHERGVAAAPPRTVRVPDGPCRPSEEPNGWSSVVPPSSDHDSHDSQACRAMRAISPPTPLPVPLPLPPPPDHLRNMHVEAQTLLTQFTGFCLKNSFLFRVADSSGVCRPSPVDSRGAGSPVSLAPGTSHEHACHAFGRRDTKERVGTERTGRDRIGTDYVHSPAAS